MAKNRMAIMIIKRRRKKRKRRGWRTREGEGLSDDDCNYEQKKGEVL